MKWFILVVGLVVICFVAALVLGLVRGGGMGDPSSSLRHEPLPDTPLADADLDGLEFDVTARGYRMSEVDGVVDRLRRELREKDEQIAVLRGDVRRGSVGIAGIGGTGGIGGLEPSARPGVSSSAEGVRSGPVGPTEPVAAADPAPEGPARPADT